MKSAWKSALALALAMLLLCSGCARGTETEAASATDAPAASPTPTAAATPGETEAVALSEGEPDKEEMVYAKADASGNVTEVTVEATLRNPGDGEPIEDYSTLSDIRNREGDEEFTQEADGSILWENKGEDIRYEGVSDEALPVTVAITYTLDGETVSPEELAGRSGHLVIRFDYENLTAQTVDVSGTSETLSVPFGVLSMAVLDGENAQNVTVTNGRVVEMDGMTLAAGWACPGLAESLSLAGYEPTEDVEIPDYVEIEADVTDFELSLTATIVSTGLLDDLDEEDIDGIDDLVSDAAELTDATESLAEGTGELLDGVETLYSYMAEYVSGAGDLSDGAASLAEALGEVEAQKEQLSALAQTLADGLSSVSDSLNGMETPSLDSAALETLGQSVAALAADSAALGEALSALEESISQAQSILDTAHAYESAVTQGIETAQAALNGVSLSGLTDTARQQAAGAVSSALSGYELTEEQIAAASQAVAAAIDLTGETGAAQALIEEAAQALGAIQSPDLPESLTIDADNVSALVADMAAQLASAQTAIEGLSDGLVALAALPESLEQLQTGVAGLADAAEGLSAGVTALNDVLGQIYDGAEGLADGADALDSAGSSLLSAVGALEDGAQALDDGMRIFNEEAAEAISDLAGEELQAIADRLRALKALDGAYQTFSGLADGQTGSVSFIIETEPIEIA